MTEAVPLPASTVLLLRDGTEGLEVFMVTRHQKSSFLGGALVFPGGGVDAADRDPRHAISAESIESEDLVYRIAAIREVFEETGMLLAARRGEAALLGPEALAPIEARWRTRLNAGAARFAELLDAEELVAAPGLLVPFAHWITPAILPKRFDTRFYVVRAPEGQLGLHDDRELTGSRWIRPQDALDEAAAKRVRIVFATRLNLEILGRCADVEAALTAARERPIVPVLPVVTRDIEGGTIRIPAEAGYGITEMALDDY
jgi:8-oxo-dGTP pyrophosphatase MutT (NUDIX family)